MKLSRLAPAIVAGSALSGFGLSLGRDVYKASKKNFLYVIIFAAIVFSFVGNYVAGVWLARNYRTLWNSFLRKLSAVVIYIVSAPVAYFTGLFIGAISLDFAGYRSDGRSDIASVLEGTAPWSVLLETQNLIELSILLLMSNLLFVCGLAVGFLQRRARRRAWKAEQANIAFLAENSLTALDDENIVDAEGIRYNLKNTFNDRIEWMAVGRRNKRAYMHFNDSGRYTSWSGLVSI